MKESRPYEITVDRALLRLNFVIRGFWTADVLNSFRADAANALDECRGKSARPEYDLIIDLREGFVQSPEIVEALLVLSQEHLAMVRRKAVILPDSALTRSQVGRQEIGDRERRFRDEESALHWLASTRN